jgi:hypothetical protein
MPHDYQRSGLVVVLKGNIAPEVRFIKVVFGLAPKVQTTSQGARLLLNALQNKGCGECLGASHATL